MNDKWLLNNPAGPREDRPDISASEIGDFTYCARGWWLRRVAGQKAQGAQLQEGTMSHGSVGVMIASVVSLERLVRILMVALGGIAVAVVIRLLVRGH